ncbi:Polyadenylate-binding protein (RRM superfamily) [Pseudoloma neurophilia]|uniref:Polyadenylate-binding protein (RRM superfamily) n=1 Tax=Pseudoloma neurophilia TaxID=146866 RepID=A0A0R0M1S4_9MICR|nr:Polyadenylate-binding protein (RRM superfamily) [Pseudoloma neurophilia]
MFYDKENIKKNNTGNIVIKNLSPDCDSKTLNDTFSIFGEILSSKVVKNAQGQCKGFGFVQFKKKSSAKKAILIGSEIQMDGFLIKVEKYEKNYKTKVSTPNFTNIFFKNFPLDTSEEKLCEIFKPFGEITSFYFPKKTDGSLKGFGFANFNNTEDAQKSIDFLHNKDIFGEKYPEPFYVQQAQKKEQRNDLLSAAFEKLSVNGMTYKRNLYVTKLPLNYTKEDVLNLFSKWGKVISIMIGKDNLLNEERNWAYVCYSSADEATTAIEKGNKTEIEGQKLVISYFKNKSERQSELLNNDTATRYSFRQETRTNSQIYRGESVFSNERSMYRKWQTNTSSNFNKRSYDKKQMSGDLYGLVLSLAPTFSSKWKTLGIKDNEEFATKITNLLLMKSSTDVRNMIALGNVLTQNISEMLNDIQEDTDLSTEWRKT